MPQPVASRRAKVLLAALSLAAFALLLFFSLGMNRGLLLSSDIKSSRLPWAPLFPSRNIQAPALSDPVWQFVPWLRFARRELVAGRLPLWNPHQDGGAPLLGNFQSALLSPLSWPVLAFDVDPGWNLSMLLRILLAAAAAYAWLRELGRSRLAAALGAVAFALSGPFIAWLEHPLALSAAPAPLVLLFARRTALSPSARHVAGLAVSVFLVLAGGHPETQLMVGILVAAAALDARPRPHGAFALFAGAALGAGLAAPALLPAAEYFFLSTARLGEGRHPFVLPVRDLMRFVAPRLAGSNVIEAAATVSIALLLLLPFGLAASRKDRETRFWALCALGMLLAIYDTPLSRTLALHTPVYWTRLLLFLPLALGVVGSAGLDRLRGWLDGKGRRALSLAAGAGVLAAVVLNLLRASAGVHGITPSSELAPTTPLLERLRADGEVFRILPFHTFLSPDSATDYALDDVRGYDALGPAGWRKNRARIGKFIDLSTQKDVLEPWGLAAGGAALDDWNVKYLLQPPQFAFGAETLNTRKGLDLEEIYSGPDGRILRNRRARPRVRLEVPGSAAVLGRVPGRWRIDVRTERPGVLVVADPFFPGWKARVDQKTAPLAVAPGEPMAISVPAGHHQVELFYAPASFGLGLALCFVSLLVLAALLFRERRMIG